MNNNFSAYSSCNYIETNSIDYLSVGLKLSGLVLHLIYLLLVICYKQMRTKNLIFLNNKNIIVTVILLYGLSRDFHICVAKISCAVEALGLFLFISYFSYSIVLLVIYRVICILTDKVSKILKWKFICPFFIGFQITVFALNLIIYMSTDNDINYIPSSSRCAVITNDGSFIFTFLILNNLIPSIIGFLGAFWIIYKMKLKHSVIVPVEYCIDVTNLKRANPYKQTAFELSCQTIVFIFSFQIFTLSNLILIYNVSLKEQFLSPNEELSLMNFRWSAFIVDSIALFSFNPLVKQSLKQLWKNLTVYLS